MLNFSCDRTEARTSAGEDTVVAVTKVVMAAVEAVAATEVLLVIYSVLVFRFFRTRLYNKHGFRL